MPRPITYDRDSVIEMATRQFWQDGLAECNVENLTRRAKLNRHSMYKAFGGKSGLFLESIEFYVDRIAKPYLQLLDDGTNLDDLVRYFEVLVDCGNAADECGVESYDRRGCFVTNTVVELGSSDAQVATIIDRYYARLEQAFRALVERGQAAGSIRPDVDGRAIGRWLLLTSQGLSVAARLGSVPHDLPRTIRQLLAPAAEPRRSRTRRRVTRGSRIAPRRGPGRTRDAS